ncbi:MAG: Flp pilus assembly complex ATPase component TadA [Propionivibrio sp.]|jgi:MSHA biogenesis protein MshE|nr:Flp pilus assembly complex ATPase component TadA [Propionivibrio sp.]MBK7563809.1 Flp pilus assembly complex ATPase component TadA [Propionivibrio sp.]MBK9027954.1 Flp pilus assembly complex ATPase component TadA [Propionivibrio sp.]MBP6421926.1 Flp pilus assembly complex ATPase component TadA [Propionivibrio sp.]
MARPEKIRLGDLLIQQGLLTDEQLKFALDEQKRSGRKLGRIVVDSSFVTEEAISQALARQLQITYVDLKHFTPKPELINLLPEAQARRFRAVVLDEVEGRLRIGFVDPTDLQAYDDIFRLLRREIDLAVVSESQLLALIDRVYRRTEEISGLAKELTADLGDVPVEFGDLLGTATGAEEAPVVKLLQTVFEEAMRSRASDIHIEPQDRSLRVRFRIDGVLHVQMEADAKIASALALRLKLMSGLDISEKRLPQDGRFAIKVRNNMIDVRISTMPTQFGESVVMRLLNQNTGLLGLDRLNMPPRTLERLRQAVRRPSGMVLVTGPTGSGKTTTLYAALSELNTTEKKIITVEDPVEYRLPGINQVQVHEKIDLSFERVLRSALRQDPDIVLVGEMRDQTTAEIGMRAAITGHMVLSTLHTNDVISTPIRLLDMGVPRYMVALSLQLVLAQRLVRVVCENCSEPHAPTPHENEWLRYELDAAVKQHGYVQGKGCAHCGGTGYQGRTGVYEMLEMTNDIVEAINSDDAGSFVQAARRQMAGETLRRDAVRLVVAGRTTIEEAMRISNQFED